MTKIICAFGLLCAVSCASRQYIVTALPGEPGHYVLVQTTVKKRGPTSKVYDCKTSPDGATWAPECKEVKK
jgi:hypothetical protein